MKSPSQKTAALSRLSSYLHNSTKKLIFNLIKKLQFSYCPLLWMLCSKTSKNMINKLHERSLKIILNDYPNNFNILLENNNDINNHQRNIQALLVEVFKMKNELASSTMDSILNKRFKTYNLRNFQEFARTKIIYIYLHNWCIVSVAISVDLTSQLLKAILNCRWSHNQIVG